MAKKSSYDLKEFNSLGFMDLLGTNVFYNDCYLNSHNDYSNAKILPIAEALTKKEYKNNYIWKLFADSKDEYVNVVRKAKPNGYFILGEKSTEKMEIPVNTCFIISKENQEQKIHNVIVSKEGSNLSVITGCLSSRKIDVTKHIGVTEIFVGKNSTLEFTMIHSWSSGSEVYPRTRVIVAEGGKFISNYVVINPGKIIRTCPYIRLEGEKSSAMLSSFIYSGTNSNLDIGGKIDLVARDTKGSIYSNIVATGGIVRNSGELSGYAKNVKAHLDCRGLILTDNAKVTTIPILNAYKKDIEMSHEASIGRISKEKLEYLQTKGISVDRAEKLIVNGFISNSIDRLSDNIKKQVYDMIRGGNFSS